MRKILLLEDNANDADLVKKELNDQCPSCELLIVNRVSEARQQILNKLFDIALFDVNLPDGSGMELLVELRDAKIEIPIIILTGAGTEDLATAALKAGANNYIPKKAAYYKSVPEQIEYTLNHVKQNSQSISVLYVEHHQSDFDLTARYLKKHAPFIHLTKAIDSKNALALLPLNNKTACAFDLLLLDYRLPGLNAIELSKIIRQERKLSIAIVIVTGQGNGNIAVEALKMGVDDYLVKRENYLFRLSSILMSAFRKRELERKQIALQESERKYKLLADYASDWEFWVNPQGEYIYCSPACEKISGYAPEAFINNKNLLIEIVSPEYKELLLEHIYRDQNEMGESIEFTINCSYGETKWISHVCRSVYDENNNYLGKRGINRDITERKKYETELIQSNERFKRLFENLGDAVYVTQIGKENMGQILEVNAAAVLQTGYSKEELLQMNIIKDLYISESGKYHTTELDNMLQSGKIVIESEKKRRKDGSEFWTEVIVTPIEFNGEQASLSINRDITERKRAELIQQIILNISNATQVANNLSETMQIIQKELGCLMDTKNFYVALYNKETDRINLPYFQDEMDNIDDFPAGNTLTAHVIKSGKSLLIKGNDAQILEYEGEIEKVGFDSEIWLGVPLKIKGEVTGAFVIQSYTNPDAYTDKDKDVLEIISHQISISIERKREEEKLKVALEAAEESDRMKTAFLANMSHELRTPLNAVIGFSALLDRETSTADVEEFAQLIQKSGSNLLEIVDEIFEVTLIERGEIGLSKTQKAILPFLDEIFQIILTKQKNFKNNSIYIQHEIQFFDKEIELFTDFAKLKQILLSLLNNALKFTHKGTIQFGLSSPSQDDKLLFYVKDTGIGIPKDKQNKIFERFQIVDNTRTRSYSGIGMGLFITRKLVMLLGGEIWFESEEGAGTTFYFTIPK